MRDKQFLDIEKPARYIGQEMGSVIKREAEMRFVLAFPDVYEVGMSHLGIKILYSILNKVPWIAAERVFAPWPDMEELMRSEGIPLSSLETATPLSAAQIVGFTLQYELSYTNILNMLELGGIAVESKDRRDNDPLVIGGGPCCANPEPLADFFDAFLLGDGEDAVLEIAETVHLARKQGVSRGEILSRLAMIEGVYVPSFFAVDYATDGRINCISSLRPGYGPVRRRFVSDLDQALFPVEPVIPFMKAVHDRVSIEIARGCTRGCRFCQAGYIYRPVRERSPDKILELVAESLRNSGYEEISLLSLSAGDYCRIEPLLKTLMATYVDDRIAVSLPSLRVGTLTPELVEEIRKVRKTGFTLAPEAGSERLRTAINKGISEDDLLQNAYSAYAAGWRLIKLYFMMGLPGETEEDLSAIVSMARKVKFQAKTAGRGGEVNVSVSTFVPKAHTPFQWEPQISEEETLSRQRFLRNELRRGKLNFKWHDAPLSMLEGVFARGDRRLAKVLLRARKLGCCFDGWSERFDVARWQQAFSDSGIDPNWYHRRRGMDEILPWDHLDFGVSKEFLLRELERSGSGVYTEDCRNGACSGCGVCDFDRVKMRTLGAESDGVTQRINPRDGAAVERPGIRRIRMSFTKTGTMRFLSHLEMLNMFSRAVGRAGIPMRYSQGFHPHPRFSFATALSVGVESYCEYMDMDVYESISAASVASDLNRVLPEGVRIVFAEEIPLNSPSLSVIIDAVRYRVTLWEHFDLDLAQQVTAFVALDSCKWVRQKRGKTTELDLRQELKELKMVDGTILEMVVSRGKPLEFASAITGLPLELLADCRIEKTEVIFSDSRVDI
ncbi:putative protein [Geobacter sp. OR-1]|uniref:TIGR03960 family B12-binding radical SAM protein n=1 Tax=Geobacter sp. OR-1 TaxID=1266765 RepID=UPI0005423316|nr:TIGR03960 family B12-binding radical SAM protein [Geobacter sp. OR-1]GAM10480.1 putative protein [Geobacter sp. OR-1]